MQLVVLGTDEQWDEITIATEGVDWVRAVTPFSFAEYSNATAFFILVDEVTKNFTSTDKTIFLNSVTIPLHKLNTPPNVVRINGWPTFLQRSVWEIGGNITIAANDVLVKMNKQHVFVKDEVGFVADKTVAMIINEAFFALGDGVSTESDIDIAMKLGTNYPYGPFEWATKIGVKNIYNLLFELSKNDTRYTPAPSLVKRITQQ
jgi:3-hydroxybutyryl-CoA dehydrogenase